MHTQGRAGQGSIIAFYSPTVRFCYEDSELSIPYESALEEVFLCIRRWQCRFSRPALCTHDASPTMLLICYNRKSSRPAAKCADSRARCWKWRYRLGVRTEDSQSSNPGSIPGSATITAAITYAISEHSLFLSLWPILWPPYCTVSDNC